jgi:hypothetical protein
MIATLKTIGEVLEALLALYGLIHIIFFIRMISNPKNWPGYED